ncbi:MAG: hypothetical protein OEW83_05430, partial [Acidimicrobiia bacterium]|nr:hypothetical protein [Acidimicrobiia bacterium]
MLRAVSDAECDQLRQQLADVYRDGRWICVATMAAMASRILGQVGEAAGFEPAMTDADHRLSPIIGLAVHDLDPDPDNGFPVLSLDRPSSGDLLADTLGTALVLVDIGSPVLEELDAWDP